MTINNRQDYVIIDLIQQAVRNVKAQPLNLGGVSGAGGGEGGPPGGFIGLLAQTKVAYDTDEASYSGILSTPSGSLVDNLAHIRYRLGVLESGGSTSMTVIDDDIPLTIFPVDTIHFSGAGVTVIDLGGGEVAVEITASGGSASATPFAIVSSNYTDTTITDGSGFTQLIINTEVVDYDNLVSLSSNNITVSQNGWYDFEVIVLVTVSGAGIFTNDGYLSILLNNTGTFDNTVSYHPTTSGSDASQYEFISRGSVYLNTSGGANVLSISLDNNTGETINAYVHEAYLRASGGISSGGGSMPSPFALPNDISPAAISSDQNDYNPTGLSTADVLRLSSTGQYLITGLQGGSDGRIITINNIGTNNIILINDSAFSSAANRFLFGYGVGGIDYNLSPNTSIMLQYDSTSQRWRGYDLSAASLQGLPIGVNIGAGILDGDTLIWDSLGNTFITGKPLVVEEFDGSPTISNVDRIIFSGASVTDLNDGDVLISISGGGGTPLVVKDFDNSPTVSNVDTIIFSGATITDLGSGDVLVQIVSSGGAGTGYVYIDQTGGVGDTYGVLSGAVNGVNTVYTVSAGAYNSGTLVVYLNGQLQTQGTAEDWTETNPTTGTFTFSVAPMSGDEITVVYVGGTVATGDALTLGGYSASSFLKVTNNLSDVASAATSRTNLGLGDSATKNVGSSSTNVASGDRGVTNGDAHDHHGGDGDDIQFQYIANNNGWTLDEVNSWNYVSADAPTFVMSINADMTNTIFPGMRIRLTQTTDKYFIVTAVGSYSGGVTNITLYGGTDYTLTNATINNRYYSNVHTPQGFPMSPEKWTVSLDDTTNASQATPTNSTTYNLGSLSISLPIGVWKVTMRAMLEVVATLTATRIIGMQLALSTANNSISDSEMAWQISSSFPNIAVTFRFVGITMTKTLSLASKTTHYLVGWVNVPTDNATSLAFRGDFHKTMVRAVSAYL